MTMPPRPHGGLAHRASAALPCRPAVLPGRPVAKPARRDDTATARTANLGYLAKEFRLPLVISLVVLLVLLCAGWVVLWAKLVASNTRLIDAPGGDPIQIFPGGVMARHVLTSGTLARLELFDWGVRLRGIAISRWLVPTWEARYSELAIAELVALPQSRNAVWFRLRGQASGIAFLSDHNLRILPLLEKHGVPVNRSVTKIRRIEELYS
jgi:hypothetical protein